MTFVQRVALACLILALVAPMALAGPNAGGVLVVHSTTLAYTDTDEYIGQSGIACGQDGPEFPGTQECPPYDPIGGATPCNVNAAVATSNNAAEATTVWFVLAAFAEQTCPRLKATAFAFRYDSTEVTVFDYGAQDPSDPQLVFELPSPSQYDQQPFPASGSSMALSFTQLRTSQLQELIWFAGYSYTGSTEPRWQLQGHANALNRFFVDDSVPPVEDAIEGYGYLGFEGTPGFNPSPVQPYACCIYDGLGGVECRVLTLDGCTAAGGNQLTEYFCTPEICFIPPVQETTWGQVKVKYTD